MSMLLTMLLRQDGEDSHDKECTCAVHAEHGLFEEREIEEVSFANPFLFRKTRVDETTGQYTSQANNHRAPANSFSKSDFTNKDMEIK